MDATQTTWTIEATKNRDDIHALMDEYKKIHGAPAELIATRRDGKEFGIFAVNDDKVFCYTEQGTYTPFMQPMPRSQIAKFTLRPISEEVK